VKFYGNQQLTA